MNKKWQQKLLFLISSTLDSLQFVSPWKHAVQLLLWRSCLSFELGATLSVSMIAHSSVPCMDLVLSCILHEKLRCGFILCLTCTLRTKHHFSLPLPTSLTWTFLVREPELLQSTRKDFRWVWFPVSLSVVILYLFEWSLSTRREDWQYSHHVHFLWPW